MQQRYKIPHIRIELVRETLYLKVTVPGSNTRKFKNLQTTIDKKYWDKDNEIVKKAHPDAGKINATLLEEKNAISEAFKADAAKGVVFTVAHIEKRLAFRFYDPTEDFYAFCTEQVGIKDYSSETRRTYYAEISKMKIHAPSLAFADITYSWLQGYENYMRTTLLNHDNTVWKSLKFLNTMLNTALKVGGLIDKNPFADYKRGGYKQGIPHYVEWAEAQKIHAEVKKCKGQLRVIGYYALLSFYTGLRFSDALKFDYSKKVTEDTTGKRLLLYAQKNGEIVSIGFNKYIAEVVEFIKDNPLEITNQEYNENIKLLCAAAKVENYKDVSSHSFRHGFAMRCCELKMSIDDVQKLMGHNKRSSTEIYFRIKSARLDAAMKLWE